MIKKSTRKITLIDMVNYIDSNTYTNDISWHIIINVHVRIEKREEKLLYKKKKVINKYKNIM